MRLVRSLVICLGICCFAGCSSRTTPSNDLERASHAITSQDCEAAAVDGKVGLCHATNSTKNPYNFLSVSVSGCISGHAGHVRDFISNDETCSTRCAPTTCAAAGANCGSIPNACGGTLSCGTCASPQTCGGAGQANHCGCTPTTCAAAGANCGSIADGCGGTLSCGSCSSPQTCGGAGQPNHCGCTPTTCAAAGANCGSIPNACGGTLSCGTCASPQTCGGAGQANHCGCTPTTCAAAGANCGSIADGCGGTLSCGSCSSPQTCGGAGQPNHCGCTPTTCAAAGANCGSIADGCGGTLSCGSCSSPQTCGGAGQANHCGCTPTTCAAAGANCGSIADGCGGTLSCGSCSSPQTCGGAGQPNQCGCTPTACGVQCGQSPDGCGGMLDCGACCQALDACHQAGVKDPVTHLCSNPPAAEGTSCDDNDSCTAHDACTAGHCIGTAYVCDDGLACTTDSCNGDGTCKFALQSGYCIGEGVCQAGGHGPVDPEPADPTSNAPLAIALSSAFLGVDLTWDGRFTIGAFNPAPWGALWGWPDKPWTSSTSIRVDDNDACLGALNDGQFLQYPYAADAHTSVAKWQTGPIVITQTLRIVSNAMTGVEDVVKIQYDVSNTDSDVHDVGLRMLMDTEINGSDGAPFRVPGLPDSIASETELLGADVPPFYQAFNSDDLVHVVQGTLRGADATPPDRLAFVSWYEASPTAWDYDIIQGRPFGDPSSPDSAVLLYWYTVPLEAGASRRYVTYYGVGSLSGSSALVVTGPARLGLTNNAWSPSPFAVMAYLGNKGVANRIGETLTLDVAAAGLALAEGESATHDLPEIYPDTTVQTAWQVVPLAVGTWSYGVSTSLSTPLFVQRSVNVPQPWLCVP